MLAEPDRLLRPRQLHHDRGDQPHHDHRHQHVVGGPEEAERIVPPEPEAALGPVEQVAEPEVDAGEDEKHRTRCRHQDEARGDGVGAEEAEEAQAGEAPVTEAGTSAPSGVVIPRQPTSVEGRTPAGIASAARPERNSRDPDWRCLQLPSSQPHLFRHPGASRGPARTQKSAWEKAAPSEIDSGFRRNDGDGGAAATTAGQKAPFGRPKETA